MEAKTLARIREVVKQEPGSFGIMHVAKKARITWPTARAYLLKLMSLGEIEGEELTPRGWVFRAKKETKTLLAPIAEEAT